MEFHKEKRREWKKEIFEFMTKKLLNLMKDKNVQMHEDQWKSPIFLFIIVHCGNPKTKSKQQEENNTLHTRNQWSDYWWFLSRNCGSQKRVDQTSVQYWKGTKIVKLEFITQKIYPCPGWCGSVDWVPACKARALWFDSQSGHMPGLQARPPVGDMWEATTHWCFFPSLSPSLPLSLKINLKIKKK